MKNSTEYYRQKKLNEQLVKFSEAQQRKQKMWIDSQVYFRSIGEALKATKLKKEKNAKTEYSDNS